MEQNENKEWKIIELNEMSIRNEKEWNRIKWNGIKLFCLNVLK